MNFGVYDPSAPYDHTVASSIVVRCNKERKLEVGLITNDSCTQRYLRSVQNRLAYNLYQDAGHSIVWGSKNPRCGETETTEKIVETQFTIYGAIPRLQTVQSGTYSDLVTVQVDF